MFDDDSKSKSSDDRGPKKPPGGFKVPPSTWLAWIAIIGSIVALMLLHNHMTTQAGTLSQADFLQKFESNQIAQATINFNPQSAPLTEITGTYYKTDKDGKIVKPQVEVPFVVENAYLTPEHAGRIVALGQDRR